MVSNPYIRELSKTRNEEKMAHELDIINKRQLKAAAVQAKPSSSTISSSSNKFSTS